MQLYRCAQLDVICYTAYCTFFICKIASNDVSMIIYEAPRCFAEDADSVPVVVDPNPESGKSMAGSADEPNPYLLGIGSLLTLMTAVNNELIDEAVGRMEPTPGTSSGLLLQDGPSALDPLSISICIGFGQNREGSNSHGSGSMNNFGDGQPQEVPLVKTSKRKRKK